MKSIAFKKLSVLLVALILVLSACSSGGGSQQTSGDKNDKSKSGDKKKDEVVTIVWAHGKDSTGADKKIVEAFNQSHDNIKVKVREMPTSSDTQHQQYVTMLNGKSSEIDVFDIDVVWPAEFAQAEYIMPLNRFIMKDGFNTDQYNEGALDAARFDGKIWALPRYVDAGLLFYRKDMVEEPPKTWDELIEMASKLQGKKGTEFGYLMQAKQYEGLVCNALEYIAAYGGNFVNQEGEVVINSKDAIQGLKKMVEVVNSDFVPKNITTFTEVESHTAFIEGQSPFIRNWPYQYALANNKEKSEIVGKVGVAPLPAGDAGSAATLGGWMGAINAYSDHPKAAWEFLKFMAGPEGQKINAVVGGRAPSIPKLFEDPEVTKANPHFALDGFVEGLNSAVPRPVVPNYPEISEIIQIHVSKAITGKETVKEAVKGMEKEMKAALGQ